MRAHGHESTYAVGCRCVDCTEAHARCTARWRAKAKDRALSGSPDVPHGRGGYTNWSCRCDVCKKAGSAAYKAYYANGRRRS